MLESGVDDVDCERLVPIVDVVGREEVILFVSVILGRISRIEELYR
jgi:hypothetical protein